MCVGVQEGYVWVGRSSDTPRPTGDAAHNAFNMAQCLFVIVPVNVDEEAADSEMARNAKSRMRSGVPLYKQPGNEWRYMDAKDGGVTINITHQDGRGFSFKVGIASL